MSNKQTTASAINTSAINNSTDNSTNKSTDNSIGNIKEETLESHALIHTIKLNDKILAEANQLLSIWGMTVLQYNTLRILYCEDAHSDNAAGEGLSSKDIGQKLNTRVPDVTRLLDRLADKGWITRERDALNRRVVRSGLTDVGVELVESAYAPLQELESQQLSALTKEEKETLVMLLNKAMGDD